MVALKGFGIPSPVYFVSNGLKIGPLSPTTPDQNGYQSVVFTLAGDGNTPFYATDASAKFVSNTLYTILEKTAQFAPDINITVSIGATPSIPVIKTEYLEATSLATITFICPPGSGQYLPISLIVDGTSYEGLFSYDPPIVTSVSLDYQDYTLTIVGDNYVYDALQYLRAFDDPQMTLEEIKSWTGHDVTGNASLIEALRSCPQIEFIDANTLAYKPKYKLSNVNDLKELFSQEHYGLLMSDLEDSYPSVMADIKSLKDSKEIIAIYNKELKTDVLHYNDIQYHIPRTQSLVNLWHAIQLPKNETDLVEQMKQAKVEITKSFEATKKITKSTTVTKDRKKRRTTNITNTHMPNYDPNTIYKAPSVSQ
eukprot:gene16875-20065_t